MASINLSRYPILFAQGNHGTIPKKQSSDLQYFQYVRKKFHIRKIILWLLESKSNLFTEKNEQEILEWLRENVELWSHDIEEH